MIWITYGYDRDGNVLYKDNGLSSSNSDLYGYDDLNRLLGADHGTLNSTKDTITTLAYYEGWDLDALGNQLNYDNNGTTESQTHNSQNQTTGFDGNTLEYDDGSAHGNGNLTTNENGYTLKYDAWNRLVEVKDGGTTLATYTYDGQGWRITQGTTDLYYSDQWQVLEERNSSGTPTAQYVWSPTYVNTLVERDADLNSDGDFADSNERLYAMQDANYNVTGLVNTSGTVVERYLYKAYGPPTVIDDDWSSDEDGTSDVGWSYLYQGERYDPAAKMYEMQNREYDPTLGTWVQQDPTGYVDGGNLYQFVRGNPITGRDLNGFSDDDNESGVDYLLGDIANNSGDMSGYSGSGSLADQAFELADETVYEHLSALDDIEEAARNGVGMVRRGDGLEMAMLDAATFGGYDSFAHSMSAGLQSTISNLSNWIGVDNVTIGKAYLTGGIEGAWDGLGAGLSILGGAIEVGEGVSLGLASAGVGSPLGFLLAAKGLEDIGYGGSAVWGSLSHQGKVEGPESFMQSVADQASAMYHLNPQVMRGYADIFDMALTGGMSKSAVKALEDIKLLANPVTAFVEMVDKWGGFASLGHTTVDVIRDHDEYQTWTD